ncbi:MAG: hypothetical protein E7214_00200 [Clostridium sp.]|nr:hypothetical protein [Clostridium sp.]
MKKEDTLSRFILNIGLWIIAALFLGRVFYIFNSATLKDTLFIISLIFVGIGVLTNLESDLSVGSLREVECINYNNEVIRKKEVHVDNCVTNSVNEMLIAGIIILIITLI